MARVLDSVEARISTDFAILTLEQEPGSHVSPGPYATSAPGTVRMMAGTKYAEIDVRVERWDAKPPPADDLWEDQDVLPWRAIDGASEAQLSGFDPPQGDSVDVRGLDRGRVEVLAWGRNRYFYGDGPRDWDELPRERWLLRLWPDTDGLDALAGPPRRLIGRDWLPPRLGGFRASFDALHTSGWWSALSNTAFADIFYALFPHTAAFRAEDLFDPPRGRTLGAEVRRGPDTDDDLLQRVGDAAGVEIVTYRDALHALLALGVFATVQTPDGQLLIPNPVPPISAWEIVEPPRETGHGSPRAVEFAAYGTVSEDLLHQARWADDGVLRATPERIASRLGLSRDEVLGALRFLAALGHVVEPPAEGDLDTRSPIALSATVR